MTESIITISIVGFLAGLIFSMPIAGPISILITTNALKGQQHYCNQVNIGASFATFTYVFFAAFGLTKLYPFYKPAIPYLLSLGSIFLLFLGYRIIRSKIDIEHIEDKSHLDEMIRKKKKSGFYTGSIINFLNPTLVIGWLTSTFLVISFVSSLGYNTGGLNISVNQTVKEINNIEGTITDSSMIVEANKYNGISRHKIENSDDGEIVFPKNFHLIISLFYALFIAAGSITWFYILVCLITRFRKRININVISIFVKSLGVVLCFIGCYFGYLAGTMLLHLKTG